jgi:hypothetical protein
MKRGFILEFEERDAPDGFQAVFCDVTLNGVSFRPREQILGELPAAGENFPRNFMLDLLLCVMSEAAMELDLDLSAHCESDSDET